VRTLLLIVVLHTLFVEAIISFNMSSMDFLCIADRNARGVSLLEQGARKEAHAEWKAALRELLQRKRTKLDESDVRFEDGSYRCFNDAPLNSTYDNDTYSVAISPNKESSFDPHSHSIYSSAFLLAGDVPIVREAVGVVVLTNLALYYHQEGGLQEGRRHKTSEHAYHKAKMLYTKVYHVTRRLFKDQPVLKESVALRVLFTAICYNLSNLHWFVYCDPTAALLYMRQFQSMMLTLMNSAEEEQLPECDVQFFQRSRLFYVDFALDHSPFMFSPAA
jgi:hypothetical protein